MNKFDLLAFSFSPISFFLIGWYSGREDYVKGSKASFIKGLKVFCLIFLLNLVFVGLFYLFY